MSVRTTVTLDEDVLARVKQESEARRASFEDTLNDLLRAGLSGSDSLPLRRTLKITPYPMGQLPGLNYDSVESLIESGEGEQHR